MGTCCIEPSQKNQPIQNFQNMSNNTLIKISKKKPASSKKEKNQDKNQYILPKINKNIKRGEIPKNFKFCKHLAEGATSTVLKYESFKGEKFAIKRIFKENIKQSRINNIIKECELSFNLMNKNIIRTYEIYEDLIYINIVMELGDYDLQEFINIFPSDNIPDDLIIMFLIQIFESIVYLHNNNIIHCCIIPENYLLKFEKHPSMIPKFKEVTLKLIGFGNVMNKPLNNQKLHEFSSAKGFLAPEILENSGFNEKIDEWGAGIIMYSLLTRKNPFESKNDIEYRNNIRFKKINFDLIKNKELRELNKKLLNRFADQRIDVKEALSEIKKIEKNLKSNSI